MALVEVFARRAVAREAALGVGIGLLRLDRLDISGHRMKVVVAQLAQAFVDCLLHRPERDAVVRRDAGLQEFRDLVLAPGVAYALPLARPR